MTLEKDSMSDEKLDEIVNKIAKGSKKNKSTDDNNVNIDDVDFNKLDKDTKKVYTDLFSGMPDVYKLVGASPDESQESIKKKCNEKLAKYHPDKISVILNKYPSEARGKEKKRLEMQYKLIREAYSILRDPHKRKYYDLQRKTIDSKNFVKQKSSFEDFIKLQESEISEQSKKLAKNNFDMGFIEMDKKHNFDRKALDDTPLSKQDMDKRYQDMMLSRDQQDIEYLPKNMFEGKSFNPLDFNKAWEKQKKKDERKSSRKTKENDRSLTMWDGLSAANDMGLSGSDNYVPIDSNYEDLYSNDNFNNSLYASKLDSGSESEEFSSESEEEIDVSYVTGHNQNKGSVMDKFAEYEKSRQLEDDIYEKREFGDKNSWKSVMENPMNISSQMGNFIGKENTGISGPKQKKQISKDMAEAYRQLMYDNGKK